MGIREFLERKQLEEKEDLKLSDLNLEQEEKEERNLYFEIENEVMEQDFEKIMTKFQEMQSNIRDKQQWHEMFLYANSIKEAFSEKKTNFSFSEQDREELIARIDVYLQTSDQEKKAAAPLFTRIYLENCVLYKTFFPKQFNALGLIIDDSNFDMYKRLADEFPEYLSLLKIIWPDTSYKFDRVWALNKIGGLIDLAEREKDWSEFSYLARTLSIVSDLKSKPVVDQKFRQGIKKSLDLYKKNQDWPMYVGVLANLAVISAHEIKFTDHGLELVMRKPAEFKPEKHIRPERREQ